MSIVQGLGIGCSMTPLATWGEPVGRERPGEELHTKVESSCFLLVYLSYIRAKLSCSEPLLWYLASF